MKITWAEQLGRTRATANSIADGVGHELAAVLVPLRKRALADSAIRWALRALGGWAVATAGLLTWSKFQLTTDVPLVTLSLGPPAALLALGGWLAHRPTTPEVARVADARLDLKERLSSALCFIGSQDEMAELLRADAVACARERQPRDAYPVSQHRRLAAVVLAAVFAVGVLVASPDPQAGALARRAADQAALAEARKAVALASQGLGKPSSAQARRLAGALRGALVGLGRARGPLSGLVVLSSLQSELSALGSRSSPVDEGAAAAAGDALVGAPGAGPVWQSLADGDLGAAASALRALAVRLPSLTPAQREALATALANAGSAAARAAGSPRGSAKAGAGGTDAGLARGLSRAARALAAGQTRAAGQALVGASNSTKALAAAASLERQLKAARVAVQDAEQQVAGQAQADLSGGRGGAQGAPGTGQGPRRVQGQGPGAPPAPSSGRGAGAGQGGLTGGGGGIDQGQGLGHGKAHGSPSGTVTRAGGRGASSSLGGSPGPGSGGSSAGLGGGRGTARLRNGKLHAGASSTPGTPTRGGTKKLGSKSTRSDQVFVAGRPGLGVQGVGEQPGEGISEKTTGYKAVLPAFERTALQGLGHTVLDPDDQDLVRSYFASLAGSR